MVCSMLDVECRNYAIKHRTQLIFFFFKNRLIEMLQQCLTSWIALIIVHDLYDDTILDVLFWLFCCQIHLICTFIIPFRPLTNNLFALRTRLRLRFERYWIIKPVQFPKIVHFHSAKGQAIVIEVTNWIELTSRLEAVKARTATIWIARLSVINFHNRGQSLPLYEPSFKLFV